MNKWAYEYWFAEDKILSLIESEAVMASALTCINAPRAAIAHLRGIVRIGGSKDLAERTQNLAIEVARKFNVLTGDIDLVSEIDFAEGLDITKW